MESDQAPLILAVDDDPGTLGFIAGCLETAHQYRVVTAANGPAALEYIRQKGAPAVIIADMHMPGMDGAVLLASVRQMAPDTTRMLFTGDASIDSAIEAINVGQIFRFLTKPCQPAILRPAVAAAVQQHHLLAAERVLLEQTLQGTVKALVDVLALTNSVSFGRAMRIKRHVSSLSDALGLKERWQVEVAAMLTQLAFFTLPAEVADKVYNERPLTREELAVVGRLPSITEQLLANIPRLEIVRAILAHYQKAPTTLEASTIVVPTETDRDLILQGSQLLRLATDFDILTSRGKSAAETIVMLQAQHHDFAPAMLQALGTLRDAKTENRVVKELKLQDIRVGMVLADDLTTASGSLLVVRGYEFTRSFVERCRSYPAGWLKEPLRVIVPA